MLQIAKDMYKKKYIAIKFCFKVDISRTETSLSLSFYFLFSSSFFLFSLSLCQCCKRFMKMILWNIQQYLRGTIVFTMVENCRRRWTLWSPSVDTEDNAVAKLLKENRRLTSHMITETTTKTTFFFYMTMYHLIPQLMYEFLV